MSVARGFRLFLAGNQDSDVLHEGVRMPTWLLILIVVLLVLAVFGGFGYSRR